MDIKSKIESLLFAAGEPLSLERLSKLTGEKEEKIKEALNSLSEEFKNQERGIRVLCNNEQWLMVTAPETTPLIQKLKKEVFEDDLSAAAQETLAVIAYKGPIIRTEINEIRGVDSSYTLGQLLSRGLIERTRHPQKSNTYLYNISFAFLQHLGINDVKELPQHEEFNK
ncbi:MAG: SMC-Scp complex subunit ScpB [Candidatus Pacebacteria bacterium]|jgi:segregation and condensation protein B|nr:SMC-Scp complex subunit ScpB [Candidatus Paceibacterota bacterium]MDD4994731.1 SMC-Scp complex subunit ScpB [Candidatus Paceibacterota bacterium]MDD5535440.1 SMC-Scp complex subunit ScpB [Candidatus Paceibacterota bacterium]